MTVGMMGGMIDLRSDTVTRPTDDMRRAMARADVGDDVYGEDPTVVALQERVAEMFGHEAALFTPTGSMANVLAVRSLVAPGQEVLCEASAHIARAELGAHGAYSGITMRTWVSPNGSVDLDTIGTLFAPDMGPFFVRTTAVSVENTHNFAGGTVVPLETLTSLRAWADESQVSVHLDGARIWNAHVATGTPLSEYGGIADVLAVCLSKGLGAPVGSLMVGSSDAITEARVWRKRMGGGMRQVGVLAAAGAYALDHHVERLADDHAHARLLAEAVGVDPETVPTNIVVWEHPDAATVVAKAAEEGVRIATVGPRTIRMVTHLDVGRADAERAAAVLAGLVGS
jgi:threonine aldolase